MRRIFFTLAILPALCGCWPLDNDPIKMCKDGEETYLRLISGHHNLEKNFMDSLKTGRDRLFPETQKHEARYLLYLDSVLEAFKVQSVVVDAWDPLTKSATCNPRLNIDDAFLNEAINKLYSDPDQRKKREDEMLRWAAYLAKIKNGNTASRYKVQPSRQSDGTETIRISIIE